MAVLRVEGVQSGGGWRMNILFCSVPFRPSVGGLETVSAILAERFHEFGHRVTLITQTPARECDAEPFTVVRRPSAWTLLKWVHWADVVVHNNVSLRLAWPLLVLRRPWVVAHHMWAPRVGRGAIVGRLKHWVCRFATNIAVSRAMAESLRSPAAVIPNPYADGTFRHLPGVRRDRDAVFLGRLDRTKGAALALEALAQLESRGLRVRLTIVGSGPEESALQRQAEALGLKGQVEFVGVRRGAELAALLNEHRVIVIPSLWEEPFGVVALEGIACGCVPVAAHSGGLPDAVGSCGVIVPKNDAAALAAGIESLLADGATRSELLRQAPRHLAEHAPDRVARRYLSVIEHAHRFA